MALSVPSSGSVDFLTLANVYGLSGPPYDLASLKRGGTYVPNIPENNSIPTTNDNLNLAAFKGTTVQINITLANNTNVNLYTLFTGSSYTFPSKKCVKFIVPDGVTIGATSTTNAAIDTGTFPSDTIIEIVNNGNIYGAGGSAGNGGTGTVGTTVGQESTVGTAGSLGSDGGTAILISTGTGRTINIYNTTTGKIYAGGGGGGGGYGGNNGLNQVERWAQGGNGGIYGPEYNLYINNSACRNNPYIVQWQYDPIVSSFIIALTSIPYQRSETIDGISKTVTYNQGTLVSSIPNMYCNNRGDYSDTYNAYKVIRKVPVNGGNGGKGAIGRGYNNLATSLTSITTVGQTDGPSAKTGISGYTNVNATDGYAGGNAGDWGSAGDSAVTNQRVAGGNAGFYINRNGNTTVNLYNNGTLVSFTTSPIANTILGNYA